MEIYKILNVIVDRYSRGKLDIFNLSFSNRIPVDTTLIDEVSELLYDFIVIHNHGTHIKLSRIAEWKFVYEAILEKIDITYLSMIDSTKHLARFIKCLGGHKGVNIVDIIYVGNFLDSVRHIMKNKSIKKMKIRVHNGTYRFGHQLVDLKSRDTHDNNLFEWEQDMASIGWTFIHSTGIIRTEKIMKLVDISISTVD